HFQGDSRGDVVHADRGEVQLAVIRYHEAETVRSKLEDAAAAGVQRGDRGTAALDPGIDGEILVLQGGRIRQRHGLLVAVEVERLAPQETARGGRGPAMQVAG